MLNKATLVGRLTKDPEVRYTSGNQMAVAKFTLAVDRTFKKDGQPTADFIPIVVFGKSAENVGKYVRKGRLVAVSGRIQTRSWEDDDKKKHYATEVIAYEVDFLDRGEKKDNQADAEGSSDGSGFSPAPDEEDDLPF